MVEKFKRMIQVYDFFGEGNIKTSSFLAKRQKKFIENLGHERDRLRVLLEVKGMIPKKSNDGGQTK